MQADAKDDGDQQCNGGGQIDQVYQSGLFVFSLNATSMASWLKPSTPTAGAPGSNPGGMISVI